MLKDSLSCNYSNVLELYDPGGVTVDSVQFNSCKTGTLNYDATTIGTYRIKVVGPVSWERDYELSGRWPEVVVKPPEMTSPIPGSTLTATTVTFEWSTDIWISQYWLAVGTTFESLDRTPYGDVYSQNQYLNTSATVSGIPLNGKNLYVRLWFKSGTWKYVDYTYQTQ